MGSIDPSIFLTMFQSLITASMAHVGALVDEGTDLTWKIFGVVLAWQLLQIILADSLAEGFAAIMNVAAKTAFILFLLGSWSDGFVSGFFTSSMDQIASKAAGTGATAATGVTSIFNVINKVAQQGSGGTANCQTVDAPIYDPTTGVQTGSGTTTNCTNPQGGWDTALKVLGSPLMWLVSILLKMLVIALLILLAAVYMLMTNLGAVLVGIGLTLGPILVPWFLLEQANFLFDSWLKFTLASAFIKIVGAVLMTIVNSAILSLQSFTAGQTGYQEDLTTIDTFSLIITAIMVCIGIFLMWQVPQIASGLTGGGSKIGGKGFGSGALGKNLTPSFLK